MGRGATAEDRAAGLPEREPVVDPRLVELTSDLRAWLEAAFGLTAYHAFAWLLLQAEKRGYDGLSVGEIAAAFGELDPGLYGRSRPIEMTHLLSNAKRLSIAVPEVFRQSRKWHPGLCADEYLRNN